MPNTNKRGRVKFAKDTWKTLTKHTNYVLFYPLLKDAIHPLFDEALNCFKNGDYHASVALCRSATECAVFTAASIYNIKFSLIPNTNNQLYISSFDSDEFVYQKYPDYGKAMIMAKSRKIIDNPIEDKINQVRTSGNFVMHYYTLLRNRLIRSFRSSSATNASAALIITEGEAKRTIEYTLEILKTIGDKLLANPPQYSRRISRRAFIGYSTLVFAIAFLIILSLQFIGIKGIAIVETEVGLLTAFEFFMYNKFSQLFIGVLKLAIPSNIQEKLVEWTACLAPQKRKVITNIIGATVFLVIFLVALWLGSISVAVGVLALGFSINGTYITIGNEVFGGIVGSWALDIFFEVFGLDKVQVSDLE